MTSTRIGLGQLIRAGGEALARYTGTLLAVFLVQSIAAVAAMIGIAVVLAQAFSQLPLWDEAIDGDVVALVACLRFATANLLACVGIAFAALVLWQLASWFLVGGIYGVFAQRPEGRSETARCFGASGASTYLAYARVALYSLPNWIAVTVVFAACTNVVAVHIERALTVGELVGALTISVAPSVVLMHVLSTVADYARVELTLRQGSHGSAFATYARSFLFVMKNPLTLAHAGLGWVALAIVTIGYGYFASGHPMYGADGAIALFVIRQGVSLARMAIRFGILAGQLELGQIRVPPWTDSRLD